MRSIFVVWCSLYKGVPICTIGTLNTPDQLNPLYYVRLFTWAYLTALLLFMIRILYNIDCVVLCLLIFDKLWKVAYSVRTAVFWSSCCLEVISSFGCSTECASFHDTIFHASSCFHHCSQTPVLTATSVSYRCELCCFGMRVDFSLMISFYLQFLHIMRVVLCHSFVNELRHYNYFTMSWLIILSDNNPM